MKYSLPTFNLTSHEVTEAQFGVNVLFLWQNVGDQEAHFRVDEITKNLGTNLLRYPGGGITEDHFDINHPNKEFIDTNGNGQRDTGEQWLMSQEAFLKFCGENEISASIVLPSSGPHVEVTWVNNARHELGLTYHVEEKWLADLKTYISNLLNESYAQGVTIQTLEIGNEMLSVNFDVTAGIGIEEPTRYDIYGAVANEVIKLAQAEIDRFRESDLVDSSWVEPAIAIQAVGPNSHVKDRDVQLWLASQVQSHLDSAATAALDGVIAHHYHYETEDLRGIPTSMTINADLMNSWGDFAKKDLLSFVTEWNISKENKKLGMYHAAAVFEMFSEFQKLGVSAMQFWPMEFGPRALADSTGDDKTDLSFIGDWFVEMKEELVATTLLEGPNSVPEISMNAYLGADELKIFLTNVGSKSAELEIDLAEYGVSTSYLTEYSNLPNAGTEGSRLDVKNVSVGSAPLIVHSGPSEISALHISSTQIGGSGSDRFVDQYFTSHFITGDGTDEVVVRNGFNFIETGGGADIVRGLFAGEDYNDLVRFDTARFDTGKVIYTGDGDDLVKAISERAAIVGGNGNDHIEGAEFGGLLDGGNGSDFLVGRSSETEIIVGGFGSDMLAGGAGDDIFLFTPFDGSDVIGKADPSVMLGIHPYSLNDFWETLGDSRFQAKQDFIPGTDKIALMNFDIEPEEIFTYLHESPSGVYFFDMSTKVNIVGVSLDELSIDDFLFFGGAGQRFEHALDRFSSEGDGGFVAEPVPEDFFLGPDVSGGTRWAEEISGFDPEGGDRIWIEGSTVDRFDGLDMFEASHSGRSGVEVSYGNGSVFLPDFQLSKVMLSAESFISLGCENPEELWFS